MLSIFVADINITHSLVWRDPGYYNTEGSTTHAQYDAL